MSRLQTQECGLVMTYDLRRQHEPTRCVFLLLHNEKKSPPSEIKVAKSYFFSRDDVITWIFLMFSLFCFKETLFSQIYCFKFNATALCDAHYLEVRT